MSVTSSGVTYELPDGFNAPPVIVFGPTYPNWNLVTALYDAFASSDQTAHDMAVYAVRREYDPSDSKQVWSAVEIMMRKMGGRLEGVELDLDSLVPFKPDEYEAYVEAGNPRSEVIAASIEARTVSEDSKIQKFVDDFNPPGLSRSKKYPGDLAYYKEHPKELPFYVATYVPRDSSIQDALSHLMVDIQWKRREAVEDLKPKPTKLEKLAEDLSPKSVAKSWRDDFIDFPISTIVITLLTIYSIITMFTQCSG